MVGAILKGRCGIAGGDGGVFSPRGRGEACSWDVLRKMALCTYLQPSNHTTSALGAEMLKVQGA